MVTEATGIQQINPYFSEYLPDENGSLRFQGYGNASIQRFLYDVIDLNEKKNTLQQLNTHRPSFADALVSVAVVDAANRSMKNNAAWTNVELN